MRIALAGPARFDELASLLDQPLSEGLQAISGGSPVSILARGLHARGHDVAVVSLAHGAETLRRHSGDRFRLLIGPYRPRHRARDVFAVERHAVTEALRQTGAEVAHAQWSYEFALGALTSGIPTLVTVHDWAPTILRHHPHPYRAVRLAMATRVLSRARALTAPSPYLLDRIQRWSRADATLVPNAIADEDFLDETAIAARPIRETSPTLIAINVGWGHRKNVETLLRAFPDIRQRVPGVTLRLLGSGYGPREAAHDFAREHGLSGGVDFVGELPYRAAMAALVDADLFVHPSREESFGLVLLEAMARGVPVVAGRDSGAVPWVCAHGEAGVLTDVTSPSALSGAVSELLQDLELRRALRRDARRWARENFSLSTVLGRYEQIYRRLREGER